MSARGGRGRPTRLSQEQLDEMAELRERGWSTRRIADRFTAAGTAISQGAIEWQCLRLGVDAPARSRNASPPDDRPAYIRNGREVRPFSPQDDGRLLALEGTGIPLTRIAAELGRSTVSIRGRLLTLARRDARAEEAA